MYIILSQAKLNFINTLNVQHDSSKIHFQIKHNAKAQLLPSQTESQNASLESDI